MKSSICWPGLPPPHSWTGLQEGEALGLLRERAPAPNHEGSNTWPVSGDPRTQAGAMALSSCWSAAGQIMKWKIDRQVLCS